MKILLRIFLITGLAFCCGGLHALYNAQGGSQGVRQQVTSVSDVFESSLDVNFSTVDAQLSVIENQTVAMRSVVDGIDSQLEVVGSKIDTGDTSIASQLDVIESKVDVLSSSATLITTATNISNSGVYCLANNITGGLSITGTGITLDLAGRTISGGTYGITISGDAVTVRNGTIKNATNANILLTGNQCSIESCDLIGSATGLQMISGSRNRLSDCCAMNNSAAGFSLAQSFSNSVVNCQALATLGTSTTYGFITQSGAQNVFQNCKAQGTSSSASGAVGFGILGEVGDLLSGNSILGTILTSNSGSAYGMLCNATSSACIISNNLVDSTRTSVQLGIGYSVNACNNLFMGNTAYANDTDYQFTTSCTGDNIYSQLDVIESKIGVSGAQTLSQVSGFESKLGVCCTALDSQLDRLESKLDTADAYIISKISLPTCAPTLISTTMTISTSGAYCLANNITGGLSITGTSITLDLDGRTISGGTYGIAISGDDVTVRNGTIKNATNANILLTGNQCLIEACDLIGSITGIQLNNATRNRLAACCAMNNSAAGFSLAQSSSNSIVGCQVISTSGSGNVYGFTSQNGAQNLFEDCSAENIASSGAQAIGYGLYSDYADAIVGSKALSVVSSTSNFADGMLLGMTYSSLVAVTGQVYGNAVASVDWSPDGRYVAAGGSIATSGNQLQIYAFNGSLLTTVTGQVYGSVVRSVNWSPDGRYVAVGGLDPTSGNQLQIYAFNGSLLTKVTEQAYGSNVNSVNWSPDGRYLAVGGQSATSGNQLQIYAFSGSLLTKVTEQAYGSNVNSVNWSPDGRYLAVGGSSATSGNQLQIYAFNGSLLTTVTGQVYGTAAYSVNWSPDGRYVVVGGQAVALGNTVRIYAFDGSFLTTMTGQRFLSNVRSVNWSPDGRYLAAGSYDFSESARIYTFDGALLKTVTGQWYGETVDSVNWSPNGQYVALGTYAAPSGNQLQIIGDFNNCSQCILKDNLVSGVHNAITGGVGYLADACNNLFVGNTAYANDINNVFPSPCTGDNIYSQLDVIEAKLACVSQAITSSGTISASGIYHLANNISGDLVVSATNVTLDLNGFTINSTTTGITVTGNNATIKNGIIIGGSRAGIWLNGAQGCDLSGITCSGAYYYGFMLSGSANNNNFEHCTAQGIQFCGFYLYQSHKNTLTQCSANTISVFGFCCDKSDYNTLLQCSMFNLLGLLPDYPTPPGVGASGPFSGNSCAYAINQGTGDILDGCKARNLVGWNETDGVYLFSPNGCSVKNCIIDKLVNGALYGSRGIVIYPSGDGLFIINNSVSSVAYIGINYFSTTNSVFSNNSSINNGSLVTDNWSPSPFINPPPGGTVYGINNVPTPA